jgi:hypothetical protein
VRVFEEAGQTPVIVMGELPPNTSTSVTNMAEYLAPELIQRHCPQPLEELPPAIFLEHDVEERTPQGRLGQGDVGSALISFLGAAARLALRAGTDRVWRSALGASSSARGRSLARPGGDAGAAATGSDRQRSSLEVGAQTSIRRGADVAAIPKVSGSYAFSRTRQRLSNRVSYVVSGWISSLRV